MCFELSFIATGYYENLNSLDLATLSLKNIAFIRPFIILCFVVHLIPKYVERQVTRT